MSIADKLTTIAENQQKVYDAGKAAGSGGGEDLWQYVTFLPNYLFGYTAFPDGYELTLNVPNLRFDRDISQLFPYATGIKKLTIICGKEDAVLRSYFAFGTNTAVEEIDLSKFVSSDVIKVTKASYLFYGCAKLKTIVGVLDFGGCTELANAFVGANALVNVTFKEHSVDSSLNMSGCPNLSNESMQSIIDGLANMAGQTAPTLTFHATVGGKLTDAQKAAITAKNWELVY